MIVTFFNNTFAYTIIHIENFKEKKQQIIKIKNIKGTPNKRKTLDD